MNSLTARDYEQLQQRSMWTLLGLPSSLSWKVIALYLIPSSLSPIFIDKPGLGGTWLFWLTVIAIADLLFSAVIVICRRLIHSPHEITSRPILTLVSFFAAQVIRGGFIGQVTVHFGITSDPMLMYRIGYGAIFLVAVLVISSILIALNDQNQTIARSLMSATSRLSELNHTLQIRIDETNKNLLKYVQDNVNPRVQELDLLLSNIQETGNHEQAVSNMSHYIETELRPLSHQLIREVSESPAFAASNVSRPFKSKMPNTVNLGESVRPLVSSVLLLAALLSGATRTLEQSDRQHFAVFLIPSTLLIFWLLERGLKKIKLSPVAASLMLISVFAVVAPLLIFVRDFLGQRVPTGMSIPSAIAGAAIGAANIGYSLLIARRALAIEDLQNKETELENSLGVLRQHAWRARHRLAYVMHGSLLSALYAATIKLGNDHKPTTEVIDAIRNDISQALRKLVDVGSTDESFETIRERLSQVWEGALDIEWSISEEALDVLAKNPMTAECTGEVVREALSNASRHGFAKKARVEIKATNKEVLLNISDNGTGIHNEVRSGLGLHLYDELCTDWELYSLKDGGTWLKAKLASPGKNN